MDIVLQCSLFQSHIASYTFPKQLSKVVASNFILLRQDNNTAGIFSHSLFLLGDWEKSLDTICLRTWHQIIAEFSEVPHDFIVNPRNICLDRTDCEINTWEEILNYAKISVRGEYPENHLGRIFGYQEACLRTCLRRDFLQPWLKVRKSLESFSFPYTTLLCFLLFNLFVVVKFEGFHKKLANILVH